MSDVVGALDVGDAPAISALPVIQGNVESFDGRFLRGWASDGSLEPLRLRVVANGVAVDETLANEPRDDVIAAGLSQIGSGFMTLIPEHLFVVEGCEVELFDCRTGEPVPGSPFRIEARPLVEVAVASADFATISDVIIGLNDKVDNVAQLQAHVAMILTWLQKSVDRAHELRQTGILAYERLNDAIAAAGGLQGSIGHLYGVVQQNYPQIVVSRTRSPRVSIIIPVHDKFQLTYDCVNSIVNARTDVSYEIVIVDDCSSDETLLASLIFMGGCRVVRTPKNEGFVGACNTGVKNVVGDYVIFLNNDTIVNDGWLDALAETLDRDPKIGIVGSRLLFADGVLQEAGGIIWRDGSGWNWGRGQDKQNPLYSFMRDVDYVSGAALMIRHDLLNRLQGFDEIYAPAYYEDTDLCFRTRQAGYRVVMQPKSTIVHLEGQSNGTTTASGLKRFQVVNARVFRNRWHDVLKTHGISGQSPNREAERGIRKRALFIDETTPTPDQDAGSNAALEHMLSLQRLGYKVVFLPADNMANIPGYTENLQSLGVECWYAPFAWSVEEYFRRNERDFDLVYIHRKANLKRYLHLVKKYVPKATIIFNYADIHALRELREATLADAGPEEIAAIQQSLDAEIDLALQVNSVIVHSTYEADVIRQRQPAARVHFVPWTFSVRKEPASPEGREGVVFVGGFAHPPNADAVDWFVEDVWPSAAAKIGRHPFRIVGSRMPERFEDLRGPGIEPVGFVADLESLLDRTLLTVAPLRYGAGLKGKVLTSFSRGVPCIMSPVAAEGMNLPEELRFLVAKDAEEFAQRMVQLVGDPAVWMATSEAAVKFIEEGFSPQAIDLKMRETIADARRRSKPGDPAPKPKIKDKAAKQVVAVVAEAVAPAELASVPAPTPAAIDAPELSAAPAAHKTDAENADVAPAVDAQPIAEAAPAEATPAEAAPAEAAPAEVALAEVALAEVAPTEAPFTEALVPETSPGEPLLAEATDGAGEPAVEPKIAAEGD